MDRDYIGMDHANRTRWIYFRCRVAAVRLICMICEDPPTGEFVNSLYLITLRLMNHSALLFSLANGVLGRSCYISLLRPYSVPFQSRNASRGNQRASDVRWGTGVFLGVDSSPGPLLMELAMIYAAAVLSWASVTHYSWQSVSLLGSPAPRRYMKSALCPMCSP